MNSKEDPSNWDVFIKVWLGLGLTFWVGLGGMVFWCLIR